MLHLLSCSLHCRHSCLRRAKSCGGWGWGWRVEKRDGGGGGGWRFPPLLLLPLPCCSFLLASNRNACNVGYLSSVLLTRELHLFLLKHSPFRKSIAAMLPRVFPTIITLKVEHRRQVRSNLDKKDSPTELCTLQLIFICTPNPLNNSTFQKVCY